MRADPLIGAHACGVQTFIGVRQHLFQGLGQISEFVFYCTEASSLLILAKLLYAFAFALIPGFMLAPSASAALWPWLMRPMGIGEMRVGPMGYRETQRIPP